MLNPMCAQDKQIWITVFFVISALFLDLTFYYILYVLSYIGHL